MANVDLAEIDARVQKSLEGTNYASTGVRKLAGGGVNYVYHVPLSKPLSDGTTDVLVKHGETHMARKPEFPLPMDRSEIEYECLRSQTNVKVAGRTDPSDAYDFVVRTPKLFHFDLENGNQIMEYLPNSVDLKSYTVKYYPAPTPASLKPQCFQLGQAVGKWLKNFHESVMQKPEVMKAATKTDFGQQIKHMINFTWLSERLKTYPTILEEAKEAFEKDAAAESKSQINHGDFWTGNILIPDETIQEGKELPLVVIDWETCQLGPPSVDVGEMLAEMYALWRYKSITAGLWMMEGFANGYAEDTEASVFRTAIQIGTHLICVTTDDPTWGPPEQADDVVRAGRDILVHARKKDRAWFKENGLGFLFGAC